MLPPSRAKELAAITFWPLSHFVVWADKKQSQVFVPLRPSMLPAQGGYYAQALRSLAKTSWVTVSIDKVQRARAPPPTRLGRVHVWSSKKVVLQY